MQTVATGTEGWTVECPECGKVRIVYREPERAPVTITRGDDDALHSWSNTDGLSLSTTISRGTP